MLIAKFSFVDRIEEYNRCTGNNVAKHSSFGVECLSSKSLRGIDDLIDQCNLAYLSDLLTEDEKRYFQGRQDRCHEMANKLEGYQLVYKHNSGISLDKNMEIQIHDKIDRHEWLMTQQRSLAKQHVWQLMIKHGRSKGRLERLRGAWQLHEAYACFSHSALLYLANVLLPRLWKILSEQKRRLRKIPLYMPYEIYFQYKEYLNNSLALIKAQREIIANSMLARLKVYAETGYMASDVTQHLVQELKYLGSLPKGFRLPLTVDNMNEYQFKKFHDYIRSNGNKETNCTLLKLSWFRSDGKYHKQFRRIDNTLSLIPNDFIKLVPSSAPRFKWLFRGGYFRHEFFKDKLYIVATFEQLNSLQKPLMLLNNHQGFHHYMAQLRKYQDTIDQAITQSSDIDEKQFSSWYQKTTLKFIAKWKQQLADQAIVLVEKKCHMANELVTKITEQYHAPLRAAVLPWRSCRLIKDLLQEINDDCDKYHIDGGMREKLANMQSEMAEILSYNKAVNHMHRLAKGELISEANLEYLINMIDALKTRSHGIFDNFCQMLDYPISNMIKQLKKLLKTAINDNQDGSHEKKILCYMAVLKRCLPQTQLDKIEHAIAKYVLFYLQHVCYKNPMPEHMLLPTEKTIQLLGDNSKHAGKSYSELITDLQHNRVHKSYRVFKVKCQSLMVTLLNQLIQQRTDKDLAILETRLNCFLRHNQQYGFNDVHMNSFERIKMQLLESKQPEQALKQLSISEQGLLGDAHDPLRGLLLLNVKAMQMQQRIEYVKLDMFEKYHLLQQLGNQAKVIMAKFDHETAGYLLQSNSGKRVLFSKQYRASM